MLYVICDALGAIFLVFTFQCFYPYFWLSYSPISPHMSHELDGEEPKFYYFYSNCSNTMHANYGFFQP